MLLKHIHNELVNARTKIINYENKKGYHVFCYHKEPKKHIRWIYTVPAASFKNFLLFKD